METTQESQNITAQMAEFSRQQMRYAKLQCIFSAVAAVSSIVILVAIFLFLPQLRQESAETQAINTQVEDFLIDAKRTVKELDTAMEELGERMDVVLANLIVVTKELMSADISGMVENIDQLVTTSQEGVEQAIAKLDAIDIDTLNKAIKDLADVVEPLANFFNKF